MLSRVDAFKSLSQYRWSVLFVSGTPGFVDMFFYLGFVAAIAMVLGWRTRLVTILLWVILMSIQTRNPHLSSGADTLIRVSMFWAMFLPLGHTWSLDSYNSVTGESGSNADTRTSRVGSIATFGVILQVSCLYLFTAIKKDGPRWLEDGTALYYALGARDVSSDLGNWFFHNAPEEILTALTYTSLIIEFAIPLMLLLPLRSGWLRTAGVFLIISLHLGIGMTMTVGLFPAISIAIAIGVLPTWFWDNLLARIPFRSAFVRGKQQIAGWNLPALPRAITPQPEPAQADIASGSIISTGSGNGHVLHFVHSPRLQRPPLASLLGNISAALAIVLVLAWNIQTVSSYETPPPVRRAAISTGLYQNWSMFAPGPQTASIWFVVEGELVSGEKVDLLMPIYTDDFSIRQPVVWDQSDDIVLKDKYWRKYFHAVQGSKSDSQRFAAYTCRTWNAENTGDDRLARLNLTRGVASTRPDGIRAEPAYKELGAWNCA